MKPTLEPIIDGNPDGETILFVQGWPDDAPVWDDAVRALSPSYRCVRVRLLDTAPRWGYATEEIVDALATLMRELGRERPITLVVHDWGSVWAHAAHARVLSSGSSAVRRVATLDVAPHFRPTVRAAAGMISYQSWLLAAFLVGGRVGAVMTRAMAKAAHAPRAGEPLTARINYPYRNLVADLASGRARAFTRGYWPQCPLLFVYGTRKSFMFHSANWLAHVKTVGGEVVPLPCDHWVMRDPEFIPTLSRWLARS